MSACRWVSMGLAIVLVAGCATTDDRRFEGSLDEAARINTQLGAAYMEQGQLQVAREKLVRALEQNSSYAPAHTAMAELQVRLGDTEKADEHYKRSIRLDADNPETRNNYGVFLCDQGRWRDAERQFIRAARDRDYSTPEYAYANAGVCARISEDDQKAEEFFQQALRVNPGFHSALLEMAELKYDQGEPAASRQFLQRYHQVVRPTARSLWLGVRTERELGDREREREYARRLREHFPDSRETRQLGGS